MGCRLDNRHPWGYQDTDCVYTTVSAFFARLIMTESDGEPLSKHTFTSRINVTDCGMGFGYLGLAGEKN